MDIHIRDAVEADLSAIVDIYNEAIASRMITIGTDPVSVPGRLDWFNRHTERRPLWVAEHDGKVISWLSFDPFHRRPAYHITAEISVYVTTPYRRKGVGKTMVRRAVESGPALGARRLVGLIMATNTSALAFFGKCGFQTYGRLPHVMELEGIERDLIIVGAKT